MFNWEKRNRLDEQLKFFNATKKRFISCYAKKPRVKVYSDGVKRFKIDLNPRYGIRSTQQAIHIQQHAVAASLANLAAQRNTNAANMQFLGMLGGTGCSGNMQGQSGLGATGGQGSSIGQGQFR